MTIDPGATNKDLKIPTLAVFLDIDLGSHELFCFVFLLNLEAKLCAGNCLFFNFTKTLPGFGSNASLLSW